MKKYTTAPQATIISAVDKYLDFVSSTYGPVGKQIIIENGVTFKSVDDGKIASEDFELEDELENAVIRYVREASQKTEHRVGDGTTTAAILMAHLVKALLIQEEESLSFMKADTLDLPSEIAKVRKAAIEAIEKILKQSKQIKKKEEIYEIALNSYNNPQIAEIIADTLHKIGKDGLISVEDSRGTTIESEIVGGLEIDKGYVSPYFLTSSTEVSLVKPIILLVNKKIETNAEISPIIQKLLESGKRDIVIVADDFAEDVVTLFVFNKLKGVINPLLIKAPGYGELKRDYLEDLAMVTGATVIDPQRGKDLSSITEDDFGTSDVVRSTKDSTLFITGKRNEQTKQYAEILKSKREGLNDFENARMEKRIAQLVGGVAVIRIGATTESEQQTIKAKTEDAVHAAKMALQAGVVDGAGKTYENLVTSSEILNTVLKEPRKLLIKNGASYLDENVKDPTLVLTTALETAVSVALGLVNTGAMIVMKREEKKDSY